MNKGIVTVKRIWPFPKLVLCYQSYECEYDEPLKIYKFGLLDYKFEWNGKSFNIWIERE